MILTLITMIFGALSPLLPDLLKMFREQRDLKHEYRMAQLQATMAEKGHQGRMEEIRLAGENAQDAAKSAIELEMARIKQEAIAAAAIPSGVKWIDGWNSLIRPFVATMCAFLLFWRIFGPVLNAPIPDAVWTDEVEFTVQYVIGFFFGERAKFHARKK